jgi:hypothetical protein
MKTEQKPVMYKTVWRNKYLTTEAKTLQDMVKSLRDTANHLEQMARCGVVLDPEGGTKDDYARFVTTDPNVAKEFGMEAETDDDAECVKDGESSEESVDNS